MVPGHSCHIYEIWRSKEVKDALFKVIMWGGNASHNGEGTVFIGKVVSLLY